ncbi:hypothetical protein H6G36_25380 [Anabaena minutissima FACHB-250]|nr:hypothetical protein [Anabaena minutissima FACHB-250]
MAGFTKVAKVPLRSLYCELKHREPDDADGSREELIEILNLQVPRLKNSDMEKQWAIAQLWNKIYEPDYQNRGINQIFIFTAQAGELLVRLEVNQFTDEPSRKLPPPDPTAFKNWQQQVEKQFKKLYGISIKQWQQT